VRFAVKLLRSNVPADTFRFPAIGLLTASVNVPAPVLVRLLNVGDPGPLMLCAPAPLKVNVLFVVAVKVPADNVKFPVIFTAVATGARCAGESPT
jgi:hypothetical protein